MSTFFVFVKQNMSKSSCDNIPSINGKSESSIIKNTQNVKVNEIMQSMSFFLKKAKKKEDRKKSYNIIVNNT